jgi:predicted RNA-binding Zn ribbon-like protein
VVKRQDAPGSLELVRGFVNSNDLELGADRFDSAAGLADWLVAADLVTPAETVTEEDRVQTARVREALRVRAASGDDPPSAEITEILDTASRTGDVSLGFGPDGAPTIQARAGGVPGAVGTILALTALAMLDGRWLRMKVCPNPECRWMFYDHSKNRSGTWCQMAECGNRAKVRAYRIRRQT